MKRNVLTAALSACLAASAASAALVTPASRGAAPAGLPVLAPAAGLVSGAAFAAPYVPAASAAAPAASPAAVSARLGELTAALATIGDGLKKDGGAEAQSSGGANVERLLTGERRIGSGSVDAAEAGADAGLTAEIAAMKPAVDRYRAEYSKAVVGQEAMREAMLLALLSGGHVLLEGLPGVAKTRSVLALSAMNELSWNRIQFTKDLQPFDILGQEEKNKKTDEWEVRKGPIFHHLVLADEINRAKSQTQGALLQAMEEGHVTIAGQRHELPQPFMVLATQNPIEESGVHPLPRAQLDRFMFKVIVPYAKQKQIADILEMVLGEEKLSVGRVLSHEEVLRARSLARKIRVGAEIKAYIARLISATRADESAVPAVKSFVRVGASDRAAVTLARAAQARALTEGRAAVLPEDVQAVAHWVLDHRMILTYEAEGQLTAEGAVDEVLKAVPVTVAAGR